MYQLVLSHRAPACRPVRDVTGGPARQGKPGIVYDSQLPAGMQSVKKIQELESQWNRAPEKPVDEEKAPEAPQFVLKPEPCAVKEGDWARFCCRLTGHPRPRVMWLINGHTIVNVSCGEGAGREVTGARGRHEEVRKGTTVCRLV